MQKGQTKISEQGDVDVINTFLESVRASVSETKQSDDRGKKSREQELAEEAIINAEKFKG